MMMSFDCLDEAKRLADEVVDWTKSDALFRKQASLDSIQTKLPFSIKGEADWFASIDINNEESRFVELNDLVREIEGAYRLIHQFGPEEFEDWIVGRTESVGRYVGESAVVEEFARWLYGRNSMNTEWSEAYDQICTTIPNHLIGAVDARATTASTRYAPTETLFDLYRHGLFPFAWDWESFWCLDPSQLME